MRPVPAVGAPKPLPPLTIQKQVLANGLTIAVVERRDLPMVDLEIVIRSGAELDTGGQAGRMSMVAEMLDEGTGARTSFEIAEQLDYLGAHLSVHASWDATIASMHVLSPRLGQALDILADVMLDARFPIDEFRRKQSERLTALLQESDEAALVAGKALARGVFGTEQPYGAPLSGTYESVKRLTREELFEQYKRNFRPENAFILVVGDVSADAIVPDLDARFGGWRGNGGVAGAETPRPVTDATRVLLVHKPHAAQSEVRVGHTAPARKTEDYFHLVVLNTVLGGSFTSRLNMILRETMGVTYGASTRFQLRRNGGIFTAGAAILTEAAAESAQVIVREMERLRSEPVGREELLRAQSYIALGLPRSFETTEDIAAHVREQLLHDLPDDYWQTYMDHVFAVNAEDVQMAAARHLHPEHCTVVVVADKKDVQRSLQKTGLGELVPTNVPT